MHWIRLLWIMSLLCLFYGITHLDQIKMLSHLRRLMAVLFIFSVAMGIDYFFFDLLAKMEFQPNTQENYTNLLSVIIFTVSEGIGIWRFMNDRTDYFICLLPALLDLFFKGMIAFLVFSNMAWFFWDSMRAVVLLLLIAYDRSCTEDLKSKTIRILTQNHG